MSIAQGGRDNINKSEMAMTLSTTTQCVTPHENERLPAGLKFTLPIKDS